MNTVNATDPHAELADDDIIKGRVFYAEATFDPMMVRAFDDGNVGARRSELQPEQSALLSFQNEKEGANHNCQDRKSRDADKFKPIGTEPGPDGGRNN
jgi:hypothetical protein